MIIWKSSSLLTISSKALLMITLVSSLLSSRCWFVLTLGETFLVKKTIRKTDIKLSTENRCLKRSNRISSYTLLHRSINWVRSFQMAKFIWLWLKMNALNLRISMRCLVIRKSRLIRSRINMSRSTVCIVCIRNWNSCSKIGDLSSKYMLTNCWTVWSSISSKTKKTIICSFSLRSLFIWTTWIARSLRKSMIWIWWISRWSFWSCFKRTASSSWFRNTIRTRTPIWWWSTSIMSLLISISISIWS